MKRSAPLKRRARLLARRWIRRYGARARREKPLVDAFREAVLKRAGYRCERCGKGWLQGFELHAHHRKPRSRGGRHHLSNGAALCLECHDGVHRHLDDWREWVD